MPKGKVAKKILQNPTLKKGLEGAKLGGAAVAIENATDVIDNPWINAAEGAIIGGAVGGVPGAIAGGAIGYLIGDAYITFPMPMIAIPAHEAFLLSRPPSTQIYIRAGETLVPTGGNVQDFNMGVVESAGIQDMVREVATPKRRKTAYTRRYERAFKKLKPDYITKAGKWKKGGFRRCVKAAHAEAKKGGK